jgi:uncharacterized protein YodC (DUF2158 family)
MADEFKAGDIVQVKSGGPKMTVREIGTANGMPTVWCIWFEDKKRVKGTFPPALLKLLQP